MKHLTELHAATAAHQALHDAVREQAEQLQADAEREQLARIADQVGHPEVTPISYGDQSQAPSSEQ